MSHYKHIAKMVLLIPLVAFLGCKNQESETTDATGVNDSSAAADDHADHDHADDQDHAGDADSDEGLAAGDGDEVPKAFTSLSIDDRKSAMQQKVCPVSGESLGSMGTPKKIDVGDRSVWICCDGCEDKLLADPEKYLAKLNE